MRNGAKKCIKAAAALGAALILCTSGAYAYDAYVYSYDGAYQKSLPLYVPGRVVDLSAGLKVPLNKPKDIAFGADGLLYVADSGNNRVLVYDGAYAFVREIAGFSGPDGRQERFRAPEGVCAAGDGNLYIADTENGRIVVLDKADKLVRLIGPPDGTGITDTFIYKPVAVAAAGDGRVYAASRSSNMGVLSFGTDGGFEGFLGVQPVTFSAADMFWRTFMTPAQRARTRQNIPVDFSDIALDREGFLFVVSPAINKTAQYNALITGSPSSDYAPVKRLNPSGDDILRRSGFYPPAGDLEIDRTTKIELSASAFSSVAVTGLGIYSVIDATHQRIFTYSSDGNLLCAFGGVGLGVGQFRAAAAIACRDDVPAVLDSETASLTVFRMSPYGALVHEALALQAGRRYDEALKKWEALLPLNANLDMVYLDMGKAYLRDGKFDRAMDSLGLVGEKTYYSKAFAQKRAGSVGWMLVLVPVALAALFIGAAFALSGLRRVNLADDLNPPARIGVKKQLQYAVYPLFHPFDGFYSIKRHGRGGIRGGLIILAAAAAAALSFTYLSGYLFSEPMTAKTHLLLEAVKFVFPFLLFATANYCVTSLFDGEGKFRDIFVTVCYAALPLVLILPLATVAANFLSLDESVILLLLRAIAYGWTLILVFAGMIAVHNYGFLKNVTAMLFSLLGMLIITFLMLLFASLTQKFWAFLHNIITELSYRL